MIIAIDGPSASGKSTTAKGVAEELDILHLDTGAMYRAVTWACINSNIELVKSLQLSAFIETLSISFDTQNNIRLNGRDISKEIRKTEITSKVSIISAISYVREKMVNKQRLIAKNLDCVMEGRDIGTVVFPNADYKFFLDAKPEIRAKRRMLDLMLIGENKSFEDLVEEIKMRDYLDSNREISPLIKAKDAIIIDTTNLTMDEQIKKITSLIKHKP
jgi:cytidylate kinase